MSTSFKHLWQLDPDVRFLNHGSFGACPTAVLEVQSALRTELEAELGMVDLDLRRIGAAYYTGNCHKWMCSPKGVGFLHVRSDLREQVRPAVIGHGANVRREGRTRFHDEFDWAGTSDITPYLSVPSAIDHLGGQLPDGWPEIRQRSHELALVARDMLIEALGIQPPAPDDMLGSLASVPLKIEDEDRAAIQSRLFQEHSNEVPVLSWPGGERPCLRISAQLYNEPGDFEALCRALETLLPDA